MFERPNTVVDALQILQQDEFLRPRDPYCQLIRERSPADPQIHYIDSKSLTDARCFVLPPRDLPSLRVGILGGHA